MSKKSVTKVVAIIAVNAFTIAFANAPLAAKNIDRSLPAVLSGTMQGYQWFIKGNQYPNRKTLDMKLGKRVEIVLINNTPMGHPMHLHDGADTQFWQPEQVKSEKLSLE